MSWATITNVLFESNSPLIAFKLKTIIQYCQPAAVPERLFIHPNTFGWTREICVQDKCLSSLTRTLCKSVLMNAGRIMTFYTLLSQISHWVVALWPRKRRRQTAPSTQRVAPAKIKKNKKESKRTVPSSRANRHSIPSKY